MQKTFEQWKQERASHGPAQVDKQKQMEKQKFFKNRIEKQGNSRTVEMVERDGPRKG